MESNSFYQIRKQKSPVTRIPTNTLDKYRKGRMLGDIYGYETIGIAKSDAEMEEHLASLPNGGQKRPFGSNWEAGDIMYKDLNGDGKIDGGGNKYDDMGDRKILGNNKPRYQFGIDLNADWKGFDFRAFFQGSNETRLLARQCILLGSHLIVAFYRLCRTCRLLQSRTFK